MWNPTRATRNRAARPGGQGPLPGTTTKACSYPDFCNLKAGFRLLKSRKGPHVELVKAVVVFGVLALLLAAGARVAWKQPSLRLVVILGTILIAVLALVLGYPDVAREIFGGGAGAGLAK